MSITKIEEYLQDEFNYDKDLKSEWNVMCDVWESWYKGNVKNFHRYSMQLGRRTKKEVERLSMNMAKKVCEDWADILFNERVKIELNNETENDKESELLHDKLEDLDFWVFMNSAVEKSGAFGTGAVIINLDDIGINNEGIAVDFGTSKIALDYVGVKNIYPLSWENMKITECAFTSTRVIKGKTYLFLSVHLLENGLYVIENRVFEVSKNTDTLTEIKADSESDVINFVSRFETNSEYPMFAILRPAGTNNLDDNLPFGLPYFSQAIDTLKKIDIAFDSANTEIALGRKRVFMRGGVTAIDEVTGEEYMAIDPSDFLVHILPKDFNSDDLIQDVNGDLRITALNEALTSSLAVLGDKVGFGVQYYQLDPAGQVREIGILTQNSKLIRRKIKHEIVLESAIFDIIRAICHLSTEFLGENINYENLKVTFDNDIIDDENARKQIALAEISNGVKSKAEYREEFMGETEDEAKEKVKEIQSESPVSFEFGGLIDEEERATTD